MKNKNRLNKKIHPFPNSSLASSDPSSNTNNSDVYYINQYKSFFRRYINYQNNNKESIEESSSDLDNNYKNNSSLRSELNNIYLKNFKNLQKFLHVKHNQKGIKLYGNKLL